MQNDKFKGKYYNISVISDKQGEDYGKNDSISWWLYASRIS